MADHEYSAEDKLYFKANKLYDKGKYKEAFELLQSLAEQGYTSAMLYMASMYATGKGVAYDINKTLLWEQKAASLGNEVAFSNLGMTYLRIGDVRTARRCFEHALQAGDDDTALKLAQMYLISDKETERVKHYLEIVLQGTYVSEASREEAAQLLAGINQSISENTLS